MSTKTLGVDPGSTRIGFGIIEESGGRIALVRYGCFEFSGEPGGHLLLLSRALKKLIGSERPQRIALERLFFAKNRKTAMAVSEARGVIRSVIEETGIPLYEYTPSEVKAAVSLSGRADKKEVQHMVKLLLRMEKVPSPDDAADALALAICCSSSAWKNNLDMR